MPRFALLAAVVVIVLPLWLPRDIHASPPAPDETASYTRGPIGERIAEAAKRAEAAGFSGAVLAALDGEVVAALGVGHADLEGAVPNTPATLFEIASLTKQFTGAAAAKLAAEGKLALDDPISKHLPMKSVLPRAQAITLDQLLRHTSGIPGTNSQGGGDDIEKVLPTFLRGGPRHTPGERWEYWNQGYAVASEIIARAAGQPYTDYCKAHLFSPAGMHATRFTGDPAPEGMTIAVGRSAHGPPRSALDHPYGSYGFQYRGMGGAVSSVWDLWRWDRALHGDTVLCADAKTRLFEPGPGEYGLGWFIRRDGAGRLVHSHGGGVRGFICEMRRYPEQGALLIVLANRDDAPLRHVVADLERALFGEENSPASKPIPAALIERLVGRYEDDRGRRLVIEAGEADPNSAAPPAPRAFIYWSPNAGPPVTRATLRLSDAGEVLLDDRSGDLHPLTFEPALAPASTEPASPTSDTAARVGTITILKMSFKRLKD